ncbi:MAG TPA: cobalamin-binding protein [Acidobacteriota bacterium]|nr:cobalamin-binding protein [Acidobacteriota bacterium]
MCFHTFYRHAFRFIPATASSRFALHRAALLKCIFLPLLACLAVVSCSNPTATTGENPADAGRKSGDKVIYTDGIGRQVAVARRPQRIISLAPNITQIIHLLGADDRLIGVTIFCNWPESAKNKPKIGDLLNPNYEVILAAQPDLIIASAAGNDQAAVMKLSELGLPVYVAAPRSVEKIFESVEDLGRITDRAEEGRKLAADMRERLERVRTRIDGLPPVRAFFITWFNPLLTPGKNTFENEVLRLANVVSISSEIPQFYPRYSLEQLLMQDPDVILTIHHEADPLPDFKRTPGWRDLRAVRENRVYSLLEHLQHPSPLFVDGVEHLAQQLYPERFP